MDPIPDGKSEQRFQDMLAELTATPRWGKKQQSELKMAQQIAEEMLRLSETMCEGPASTENCLSMLKYAKVIYFVLTTLALRREIAPRTLQILFKLAGLKIDKS
jgi:hypothetical protein